MDKMIDKVTERIIDMTKGMSQEQKEQFIKSVKEVLILPNLDFYLETKASATFNI